MMMTMNQHGMGLLLAMMIAHGAAGEAPAESGAETVAPPMMIAAAARPVLIAAGEEDTFGAPAKGGAPNKGAEAADGTFRRLPAEDRRIARALLEAEQVGASSDAAAAWSLDKIASERASGKDWETIVTEMQTRSLVAAGELADVLSPRAFASRLKDSEQLSAGLAVANGPPAETARMKTKPSQIAAGKPGSKSRPKSTEVAANPGAKAASGCDATGAEAEAELGAAALAKAK